MTGPGAIRTGRSYFRSGSPAMVPETCSGIRPSGVVRSVCKLIAASVTLFASTGTLSRARARSLPRENCRSAWPGCPEPLKMRTFRLVAWPATRCGRAVPSCGYTVAATEGRGGRAEGGWKLRRATGSMSCCTVSAGRCTYIGSGRACSRRTPSCGAASTGWPIMSCISTVACPTGNSTGTGWWCAAQVTSTLSGPASRAPKACTLASPALRLPR